MTSIQALSVSGDTQVLPPLHVTPEMYGMLYLQYGMPRRKSSHVRLFALTAVIWILDVLLFWIAVPSLRKRSSKMECTRERATKKTHPSLNYLPAGYSISTSRLTTRARVQPFWHQISFRFRMLLALPVSLEHESSSFWYEPSNQAYEDRVSHMIQYTH